MPRPKKRSRRVDEDESELDSEVDAEESKADAPSTAPGTKFKETDGTTGWELGNKRRARVTTFRGKKYVDIREYYEKDGKLLPGKKGISLTSEQLKVFLSLQEEVKTLLAE